MSRIKDYLMDIEEGRIVPGAIYDKCVCSKHFSDTELQEIIKQEGHVHIPEHVRSAGDVEIVHL